MFSNCRAAGEKLIISPKYLAELKKLPPSVLSFEEAHNEVGPETKHRGLHICSS